jgi:hypothetical protein
MQITTIRRVIGLIVLIVSLTILLWAIWPTGSQVRVTPIGPGDISLPTPSGLLLGLGIG